MKGQGDHQGLDEVETRPATPAFERLARDLLGCGCDAAVFAQVQDDPTPVAGLPGVRRRVAVGGRLLIYVAEALVGAQAAAEALPNWVVAGLAERERRGMNRLRLVVLVERCTPESVAAIDTAFTALKRLDERVHLHILPAEAVAEVWDDLPRTPEPRTHP